MGKPLIVYNNVPTFNNGRPICNPYFKLCVCMYVCKYVCMYVCIYVHMYVHMYVFQLDDLVAPL